MNKEKLINLATPDSNISELQTSNPKLYRAIKNLGDSTRILINSLFPRYPVITFRKTFLIPNSGVANDVLPYRYVVILPVDSNNLWTYQRIDLTGCCITAKIEGTVSPLSVDIKVRSRGTTSFNSIFKSGFNPILPPNVTFIRNVVFSTASLNQYDCLRIDVLSSDIAVDGISLDLFGNYVLVEN
jgi:hypothetical protein